MGTAIVKHGTNECGVQQTGVLQVTETSAGTYTEKVTYSETEILKTGNLGGVLQTLEPGCKYRNIEIDFTPTDAIDPDPEDQKWFDTCEVGYGISDESCEGGWYSQKNPLDPQGVCAAIFSKEQEIWASLGFLVDPQKNTKTDPRDLKPIKLTDYDVVGFNISITGQTKFITVTLPVVNKTQDSVSEKITLGSVIGSDITIEYKTTNIITSSGKIKTIARVDTVTAKEMSQATGKTVSAVASTANSYSMITTSNTRSYEYLCPENLNSPVKKQTTIIKIKPDIGFPTDIIVCQAQSTYNILTAVDGANNAGEDIIMEETTLFGYSEKCPLGKQYVKISEESGTYQDFFIGSIAGHSYAQPYSHISSNVVGIQNLLNMPAIKVDVQAELYNLLHAGATEYSGDVVFNGQRESITSINTNSGQTCIKLDSNIRTERLQSHSKRIIYYEIADNLSASYLESHKRTSSNTWDLVIQTSHGSGRVIDQCTNPVSYARSTYGEGVEHIYKNIGYVFENDESGIIAERFYHFYNNIVSFSMTIKGTGGWALGFQDNLFVTKIITNYEKNTTSIQGMMGKA